MQARVWNKKWIYGTNKISKKTKRESHKKEIYTKRYWFLHDRIQRKILFISTIWNPRNKVLDSTIKIKECKQASPKFQSRRCTKQIIELRHAGGHGFKPRSRRQKKTKKQQQQYNKHNKNGWKPTIRQEQQPHRDMNFGHYLSSKKISLGQPDDSPLILSE